MRLGEIGLMSNDVARLAGFYRSLLNIESDESDELHQTISGGDISFTVTKADIEVSGKPSMTLAFTVDDIYQAYDKVVAMGARINEKPVKRPWGAINMSLFDPDGNLIYIRQITN